MDKYTQLEKRIQELENWKKEKTKQQISFPLDIQSIEILNSNSFLNDKNCFVGTGSLNVSGEYRLNIPGANARSVAFVTTILNTGTVIDAEIVPSPTDAGYEIYVQGTATTTFYYLVILNLDNYTNI